MPATVRESCSSSYIFTALASAAQLSGKSRLLILALPGTCQSNCVQMFLFFLMSIKLVLYLRYGVVLSTFSDLAEPHLMLVILTFFLIWKTMIKNKKPLELFADYCQ